MPELKFDNAFVRELPGEPRNGGPPRQVHGALYSPVLPTPVTNPTLVAYSREMAQALGFDESFVRSPQFAQVFGGNVLLDGMQPYAANYGGHQFGQWAGQLGDGRAITLGEILAHSPIDETPKRWELQLKGAGLTPYSRTADGRAVLRSSVREFLCSEAMHHLGVPTTRALSLVTTGEPVIRDMFYDGNARAEPGAIVCRVAPSFIRFGNFELPAARGDTQLLEVLVDFTIARDYPHLKQIADVGEQRARWFAEVCERTAVMVAHWMRVGFVHGVMNTDNMSILGLTIDYGPYGWIDNFDPNWTPNTTDAVGRRYRFGQQPQIAFWNLTRLAGALLPLIEKEEPLQQGLDVYARTFVEADHANIAAKLGLAQWQEEDGDLIGSAYELMLRAEVDMTIFFRALAQVDLDRPTLAPLENAFYDDHRRVDTEADWLAWLARYAARVRTDSLTPSARLARMQAANPKYVLRNYLAQQAIDRAEQGDHAGIEELLDVMRQPYAEQPGRERFAERRPDWARSKAGCSMLSCSS